MIAIDQNGLFGMVKNCIEGCLVGRDNAPLLHIDRLIAGHDGILGIKRIVDRTQGSIQHDKPVGIRARIIFHIIRPGVFVVVAEIVAKLPCEIIISVVVIVAPEVTGLDGPFLIIARGRITAKLEIRTHHLGDLESIALARCVHGIIIHPGRHLRSRDL